MAELAVPGLIGNAIPGSMTEFEHITIRQLRAYVPWMKICRRDSFAYFCVIGEFTHIDDTPCGNIVLSFRCREQSGPLYRAHVTDICTYFSLL